MRGQDEAYKFEQEDPAGNPYEGMRFEGVEPPPSHEEWCDERHNIRVIDCWNAAECQAADEQLMRYAR